MDPRDPDVLIAASYSEAAPRVDSSSTAGRNRTLYKSDPMAVRAGTSSQAGCRAVMSGGSGSHKHPTRPDVVYAIIEAANDAGGLYRSVDAGVNWEKRGDYVSGSPQYYQELVVDPHDSDRVYSLEYRGCMVSEDGELELRACR